MRMECENTGITMMIMAILRTRVKKSHWKFSIKIFKAVKIKMPHKSK